MDVKYLPQMADESARRYVFVAIDRATRWVYIALKPRKTAATARSFLQALAKAALFHIHTLLTDNGKEFTDRLFGKCARDASGTHAFDALCEALGIEHRLTHPKTPQTNGRGVLQRPSGAGAARAVSQRRRGPVAAAASLRLAVQPTSAAEGPEP